MTQSEINALKEKAQKATPGPWHQELYEIDGTYDPMPHIHNAHEEIASTTYRRKSHTQHITDAAFIAAAHPQAILALIEMNEKMREALEFYKGNFDGKEGSYWLDGYKFIQEDKFGDTKYFDNGDRARQTIALFDGEVKA